MSIESKELREIINACDKVLKKRAKFNRLSKAEKNKYITQQIRDTRQSFNIKAQIRKQ